MSLIEVRGKCRKRYKKLAKEVAEKVISEMGFPNDLEVAVEFISRRQIRRLNRGFRGIDKVTDVLSFPAFQLEVGEKINMNGEHIFALKNESNLLHFGDMAICLHQTKKQAKEYGVSVEAEIKKLVIHSMLHLMGYDHIEDSDFEIMKKEEDRLDKII